MTTQVKNMQKWRIISTVLVHLVFIWAIYGSGQAWLFWLYVLTILLPIREALESN